MITPARRWTVVAVLTVLLVAVPVALRALPVAQSEVSAARLLATVRASQSEGWSGFVETQGALGLPSVAHFDDVASLFGGSTQLRVWWQDPDHWRVDRLSASGEDDLVHTDARTLDYSFEDAEARLSQDPSIRLPRTSDLLPPSLARRALTGTTATQVRRIPARRVAGVSAPGLRVEPASSLSSVDHVDLWADPATGVPLRVEVFSSAHGGADLTTSFRDFSAGRPADRRVTFQPTPSTGLEDDAILDIADAVNQYAPLRPPASMAGLAATSAGDGAVGVYGSGLTQLISIPLRDHEADPLREQLLRTPAVTQTADRTYVQEGALGVLITGSAGHSGVLLAGTVTVAGLLRAAADAERGYRTTGALR